MNRSARRKPYDPLRPAADYLPPELRQAARPNARKIEPQACALWVPQCRGYLAHFEPGRFRTVDCAELALHLDEDDAARTALVFRETTGLRVAVRPYYGRH